MFIEIKLKMNFMFRRLPAVIWLIMALVVISLALPTLAPQDPYDVTQLSVLDNRKPPLTMSTSGFIFLLGSDNQGRDILSAVLYGIRTSVLVAGAGVAVAFVLGGLIGTAAAVVGGVFDTVVMRIADFLLSFPAVLVAIIILAVLGPGAERTALAIAVVELGYFTRVARNTALVEGTKEYVEAARGLKLPRWKIVLRHVLPNSLSPLVVLATVELAGAISLEATLSFLGLGGSVTSPSLGMLIANGFPFLVTGHYWICVFPGISLLLLMVLVVFLGDRLNDTMNPRVR